MSKLNNSVGKRYGDGYGSGYGDGYGSGSGYDISTYNGQNIYIIDGIQTIITNVVRDIAKGFMLNRDLTLTPCYIAKGQNLFAHGETAQKAVEALQEKIYANMDTDTAIQVFLEEFKEDKKYPAKAFYVWHNRLTGSCEMGRNKFISEHGYDIEKDTFTVKEFIEITKNAFGGDVIRRLEKAVNGEE